MAHDVALSMATRSSEWAEAHGDTADRTRAATAFGRALMTAEQPADAAATMDPHLAPGPDPGPEQLRLGAELARANLLGGAEHRAAEVARDTLIAAEAARNAAIVVEAMTRVARHCDTWAGPTRRSHSCGGSSTRRRARLPDCGGEGAQQLHRHQCEERSPGEPGPPRAVRRRRRTNRGPQPHRPISRPTRRLAGGERRVRSRPGCARRVDLDPNGRWGGPPLGVAGGDGPSASRILARGLRPGLGVVRKR